MAALGSFIFHVIQRMTTTPGLIHVSFTSIQAIPFYHLVLLAVRMSDIEMHSAPNPVQWLDTNTGASLPHHSNSQYSPGIMQGFFCMRFPYYIYIIYIYNLSSYLSLCPGPRCVGPFVSTFNSYKPFKVNVIILFIRLNMQIKIHNLSLVIHKPYHINNSAYSEIICVFTC